MLINNSINLPQLPYEPSRTGAPKGLYCNFISEKEAALYEENRYIASTEVGKLAFSEIKGIFDQEWDFSLHCQGITFWFAFQLLGSSSLTYTNQYGLGSQKYRGFFCREEQLLCRIKSGKVWLLLLGMRVEEPELIGQEWDTLRWQHDGLPLQAFPALNIGYRIRKGLEAIQKTKYTPYSLAGKLEYYASILMDTYHRDLVEHAKSGRQNDVSLFHRAKAYIAANYMNEDIGIESIAKALLTSERTLYRVFQENGLTVNGAIQMIRIYKGRELLRTTNTSVDLIAFQLQISSAKYFTRLYVQYFGHTPAMERKLHPPPPEEDEDDRDD